MDISTGKDKPRTRGSTEAEALSLSTSGLPGLFAGSLRTRQAQTPKGLALLSPRPYNLNSLPSGMREWGTQRLRNRSVTQNEQWLLGTTKQESG